MDIKFRLLALQKLAGCALIVLVSVGLIGIAALHPAHAQDAAPPVLDDACSKQAVSYTHLTLPTIYTV